MIRFWVLFVLVCVSGEPPQIGRKPTTATGKPIVPMITTEKPFIATGKPTNTTRKPLIETAKPTTKAAKPMMTTGKVIIETAKPTIAIAKATNKTEKITTTTAKSMMTTGKVMIETAKPTTKTAKPTTTTAKPTTKTAKPTITTLQPRTKPAKPTTTTAKPITTTAKPTTKTAKPTIKTLKPRTKPAKPTSTTAKPITTTAKPRTKPAKPTTKTAKPTTAEPMRTTRKPTDIRLTPGQTRIVIKSYSSPSKTGEIVHNYIGKSGHSILAYCDDRRRKIDIWQEPCSQYSLMFDDGIEIKRSCDLPEGSPSHFVTREPQLKFRLKYNFTKGEGSLQCIFRTTEPYPPTVNLTVPGHIHSVRRHPYQEDIFSIQSPNKKNFDLSCRFIFKERSCILDRIYVLTEPRYEYPFPICKGNEIYEDRKWKNVNKATIQVSSGERGGPEIICRMSPNQKL